MSRLTLTLDISEKNALIALAVKELRDPRFQAVLIIRQELIRCGLLAKEQTQESQTDQQLAQVQQSASIFSNRGE